MTVSTTSPVASTAPKHSAPSSGTLRAYRAELRRSHMSPGERAGLQRCAIATQRFRNRNERMAVGIRCGFSRLERNEIPADELERTLSIIRHELAVKASKGKP